MKCADAFGRDDRGMDEGMEFVSMKLKLRVNFGNLLTKRDNYW